MREIFIKIKNDLSLIKESVPANLPYRQGALHDIKCYERLLELANHGINGNQVQDRFTMDHFHNVDRKTGLTSGSMIGECPGVFKEWIYEHNVPRLKDLDPGIYLDVNVPRQSAIEFFNISLVEFCHLFFPYGQNKDFTYKNYCQLTEYSTKKRVGENMLDYLQYNIAKINQHLFG